MATGTKGGASVLAFYHERGTLGTRIACNFASTVKQQVARDKHARVLKKKARRNGPKAA
jgi:hypothetical protein